MNWKLTLAAIVLAVPASAQQLTTAAEIKPILTATKGNWVAVREFDGKDLLYFTNLLAWRCGLKTIFYSTNGGPETRFDAEPCHEDEAVPNAQKLEGHLPFLTFSLQSVETVGVHIIYDDGTEDTADYQRGAIMTP